MTAKITLIQGDITELQVDALVNAANTHLAGGGGVDGAIHRAAGPALLEACRQLKGCPIGEVKITAGFDLPAAHVIHAVGPIWQGGHQNEAALLAQCYQRAIAVAAQHNLRTIAFPAISCGVYGFPIEQACNISVAAVGEACSHFDVIRKVYLCAFDDDIYAHWLDALATHSYH
ncbi:O-acetyl-ADP-ribose deacetylase [Aestuariibacter sp. AA17]|uniref:O-acetyl-ADP-ribose deacetylase n=1 Tax=Fluctibacter corallii TaxID=2984329 RepID=A0ABT3A5G4_9ALTE|nr:O-acetyl-ADP-ribose deacetylase [Aestuariibacter sp. AA17]MCV2883507.1 O-acetyl-ADP-ribose deacetylase [Aestuariibacter sp. AA17]